MRTVEQVVLHSLCWGRRGSVRASSWLLLLYIVTWSSLKAAMPPCLSMPLIRINDVDARCVHFFPEEAALDACAVNKSHPPTPPVSRYSSSTCQLALYQTLPFIFSLWCLRHWCLRVHVNQLWIFSPLCNVYSLVKQNCLKVGNVLRRRGADNLSKDSSWNTTDNIFGCVVLFYFVNNNIGVAHYYVSERFGFWLLQY